MIAQMLIFEDFGAFAQCSAGPACRSRARQKVLMKKLAYLAGFFAKIPSWVHDTARNSG